MALVLVNNGEKITLEYLVNKVATPENLVLCLFTSNTTPAAGDTTGTYTEASGNGYANKTLTGASWTITTGAPSNAAYAEQTFTFTGALGNVYGYFLKRASTGDLAWVERFSDGPYNVQNNGDQIKVTPRITLGSQTSD
jgi:hypothetical protein